MYWIGVFRWVGACVFVLVLLVYGFRIVILQIRTGQTTAALGFPMWIVGLAIPVCSVLLLWRLGIIAFRGIDTEETKVMTDVSVHSVPAGQGENETGDDR